MKLQNLRAAAHPDGFRIDLAWINPDPTAYPGMRIVRRPDAFPTDPDDGDVVFAVDAPDAHFDDQGRANLSFTDTGLLPFQVYYYSLFPYRTGPLEYAVETGNRTAALVSTTYDTAGQMMTLLPAIYSRYDAAINSTDQGPLRRLMGMLGGELDLMRSYAEASKQLYDLNRVDGRLLPLLAQWVGWKTDFRLGIDRQRNELRQAPAIYQRVGLSPTMSATIKRITNWESRTKEYVHNIVRTNQPARLNLWAEQVNEDSEPLLFSIDEAFDGRPAHTVDEAGVRWLCYHTTRQGRSQIWYKTSPTFQLSVEARPALDALDVTALQPFFLELDLPLAADATLTLDNNRWSIDDVTNSVTYVVEATDDHLLIYHTSAEVLDMAPSKPLARGASHVDYKDPAIVQQQNALWVFWSAYDRIEGRWHMRYQVRRNGAWLPEAQVFTHGSAGDVPERRRPSVVIDNNDRFWLFWEEHVNQRWQVQYNRYLVSGLASDPPDPNDWSLATPASFPLDGSDLPNVESRFFAFFDGSAVISRRLWVCWARREPTADPNQHRWVVVLRRKNNVNPNNVNWSPIISLAKPDQAMNDRDPALAVVGGDLTLLWSGDRNGHYGIWRATVAGDAVVDPVSLTQPPFDQRHPLGIAAGADLYLLYRSNAALAYESAVFGSTRTTDWRYSGSLTTPVRNTPKIGEQGTYQDFQTYTYDTGPANLPTNADRFSRETVGVYVTPDNPDPAAVQQGLNRVRGILPEFMATTNRTVFETE